MAILDQFGNPIQSPEKRDESQTAKIGVLNREFDQHPVRGLTPQKLTRILEAAEQGDIQAQCDLFEDIEERDAHVYSEIGKRRRSVITLDWSVVPARNASKDEQADAAWAEEVLRDMPDLAEVMLDLLDAIGKGFSCVEIGKWRREGSELIPSEFEHRPARWFTLDRETRTQLRLRSTAIDGDELWPFGWIVHKHKAKSGHIARSGLMRILAWPFVFKMFSVRDLAEFLEIYGLPMRLGKYPSGATDTEKMTLLRAVINIGHAAAGIVPEGMDIDFKAAAEGASDPFMAMVDWAERTQSKAIVGQTLSAESHGTGLGSGVANLQGEVRWDLTQADARQLAGTLTQHLIYPLLAINRGLDSLRRCPRFVFDTTEADDIKGMSDALPKLVGIGMRISPEWAHERLRIPMAEDGKPVLSVQQKPAPVALRTIAALRAGQQDIHPDTVDLQTAVIQNPADHSIEMIVEKIRGLANQVSTMQELADKLLELFPDLRPDTDAFSSVMAEALTAAALAGRFDILEGS